MQLAKGNRQPYLEEGEAFLNIKTSKKEKWGEENSGPPWVAEADLQGSSLTIWHPG